MSDDDAEIVIRSLNPGLFRAALGTVYMRGMCSGVGTALSTCDRCSLSEDQIHQRIDDLSAMVYGNPKVQDAIMERIEEILHMAFDEAEANEMGTTLNPNLRDDE